MTFAFGDTIWPGLAKLSEECGEVVQVIGKLMMTHGDPVHWSGDLRAQLVDEMADVVAAVGFVKRVCLTPAEETYLLARVTEKRLKFEMWHANPDDDRPAQGMQLREDSRSEAEAEGLQPGPQSGCAHPNSESEG